MCHFCNKNDACSLITIKIVHALYFLYYYVSSKNENYSDFPYEMFIHIFVYSAFEKYELIKE